MTFTIRTQLKSGKNRILTTRTGKRYPPKEFKVWKNLVLKEIGEVDRTYEGDVFIVVSYTPGDRIKRDVSGMLDALCHIAEVSGMVKDDAQIKHVQWTTMPVNPGHPLCIVELSEYSQ